MIWAAKWFFWICILHNDQQDLLVLLKPWSYFSMDMDSCRLACEQQVGESVYIDPYQTCILENQMATSWQQKEELLGLLYSAKQYEKVQNWKCYVPPFDENRTKYVEYINTMHETCVHFSSACAVDGVTNFKLPRTSAQTFADMGRCRNLCQVHPYEHIDKETMNWPEEWCYWVMSFFPSETIFGRVHTFF